MKTLKLPTFKELKMNIKYLLIKLNPKTFEIWKQKYQMLFLKNLKQWLKINNIDFKYISDYYQILFYWSFINYHRELNLIKMLEDKNYNVSRSNIKLDAIFKVDLIAIKDNIKLYIQLKNQKDNLSIDEELKLRYISDTQKYIPIFCYKSKNEYKFINLFTNDEYFI